MANGSIKNVDGIIVRLVQAISIKEGDCSKKYHDISLVKIDVHSV